MSTDQVGCSDETPCPVCLDIALDAYSDGDDCMGSFRPYSVTKHVAYAIEFAKFRAEDDS